MTASIDRISGTVIKAHGRLFWVDTSKGLMRCSIREGLKTRAEAKLSPVVVGDQVNLEQKQSETSAVSGARPENGLEGVIVKVHPRRTKFSKPKRGQEEMEQIMAANLDRMLIISSVAKPSFELAILDRFLLAARKGGLEPIIVINKMDLEHKLDLDRIEAIYKSIGVPLLMTSAVQKWGLDQLLSCLKDRQSIIVGQSGVGKSSLLNALEPGLKLRIADISKATRKGVHTTTAVEMYPLSCGGYIVDTPGLRALGLWDIEAEDLRHLFPEFALFSQKCRFRDCTHRTEPGCGIKLAVESGEIFAERYSHYLKLTVQLETGQY